MKKIFGYIILFSPFIIMVIFCFLALGWIKALCIFGSIALIILTTFVGTYLIAD